MRVVIQRTLESSVEVDNKIVGQIKNGLTLLVGFGKNDSSKEIDYMVNKIINLRIFNDEKNVMNKSLLEVGGEVLSISQFTLYADTSRGRRPSYFNAHSAASYLYDEFNEKLKKHVNVETGIFGADMKVSLINDGPVTIILETGD
jgi:D-tyrosyl-tRNA(Tyr) deacylase